MSDQKTSVVITGGSGLVGSRIIELLDGQYDFHDASLEVGVNLLDDSEREAFLQEHESDIILHLAAYTDVKKAEEQNSDYESISYRLNVELTKRLAEYAFEHSQRFIYISTDYVFDGQDEKKFTEDDQAEPRNWYGITKYMGEREVVGSGVEYTILRIAYPFRNPFELKKDFVQKIADGIQNQTLPPMFTDQIITPTYIDDIARAIYHIIEAEDTARNEIYHIVGDEAVTPYEVAQRVAVNLDLDETNLEQGSLLMLMSENNLYSRIYPQNAALSNEKFKESFGFDFTSLDSAIYEVISKR